MNVIARNSGGANVIARPQARRPWYPSDRVRPVRVEVWWRYENEVAAAARMMGTYAPGQDVMFPFTPVVDRNLIFSTVAISPEGVRSIRELADAHEVGLVYTRAAASEQLTSMASDALTVPTGIRYPK